METFFRLKRKRMRRKRQDASNQTDYALEIPVRFPDEDNRMLSTSLVFTVDDRKTPAEFRKLTFEGNGGGHMMQLGQLLRRKDDGTFTLSSFVPAAVPLCEEILLQIVRSRGFLRISG